MISDMIRDLLRKACFERVVEFAIEMINVMASEYMSQSDLLPNDENTIRNILLEHYLNRYRSQYGMSDYMFDSEVPEHYDGRGSYIGRIDIRVKLKADFSKNDAYFVMECKRIDGTKMLNRKYVTEGVGRFVTQKYSSYYGKSIMLGFVVSCLDIMNNTNIIQLIQNSQKNAQVHGNYEFVGQAGRCTSFRCVHDLSRNTLELRHIFVDFSHIVKNS